MPLEVGWQADRGRTRVGESRRASPAREGGVALAAGRRSAGRGREISQCGARKELSEGFPMRKPSEPGLSSSILSASINRELNSAPILALKVPISTEHLGQPPTWESSQRMQSRFTLCIIAHCNCCSALRPARSIRLNLCESCRRSSYGCHHG